MIPKKIHYCWFGCGPKDKLFAKCYASWQKFFPDWEIIEWNEDNFDVNFMEYTKIAYEKKLYAFVSDVARLKIIYDEGGIYFDTDVEVIKEFREQFLEEGYFGEQEEGVIATGLGFAAPKHNKAVKIMLDSYRDLTKISKLVARKIAEVGLNVDQLAIANINEPQASCPCPILNTSALISAGYEIGVGRSIEGIPIYPSDYFCGFDYRNHRKVVTENTYSVHHYNASWKDVKERRVEKRKRQIAKILTPEMYDKMKKIKRSIAGRDSEK